MINELRREFESMVRRILKGHSKQAHFRTLWPDLQRRYQEPHRAYHTPEHIAACLAEFNEAKHVTQLRNIDAIQFALFYHDAVYQVRGEDRKPVKDNEEQSAVEALKAAEVLGLPISFSAKVISFILATKHKDPPRDLDHEFMVDIDLTSLGAEPTAFDQHTANIRMEYGVYSDAEFNFGRKRFLTRMLERNSIFFTDHFFRKYEDQAQENLKRQLATFS